MELDEKEKVYRTKFDNFKRAAKAVVNEVMPKSLWEIVKDEEERARELLLTAIDASAQVIIKKLIPECLDEIRREKASTSASALNDAGVAAQFVEDKVRFIV